jgi:thiosulfate reductase cytochrome b subunit
VPGGEPWPPASIAPAAKAATADATAAGNRPEPTASAHAAEKDVAAAAASVAASRQEPTPERTAAGKPVRRGLPRVAGDAPWPPAGPAPAAPARRATVTAAAPAAEVTDAVAPPVAEAPEVIAAEVAASVPPAAPVAPAVPVTATAVPLSKPLPFTRTVWPGAAARSSATKAVPAAEPKRIGPFTRVQWAGAVIVGGAGLLYAAAMAVLVVRWLLSTPWGVDFLGAYPGEYHLPAGAPVGLPAWLGWQHFFNVFLMVLIIRTGLQVRTEKRPTVFWSPRNNNRRKISLNLWFHQSLDILWLVNGVIFVVLLFVTGQWMRIVPTSWEVFPNAVSAALQYVSLDWPTENGWVNYNALQQLAYFVTVFVAAPLAAITGVRMSGVWPKNATGLNKAYPVEWARAVHFPVMLYFVAFIAVHVFLVFATGALRNLNHMYAAQGSTDPNAYADNWTGFWFFVASLVVIAAAWVAARPLVLAPIARLFGKVTAR